MDEGYRLSCLVPRTEHKYTVVIERTKILHDGDILFPISNFDHTDMNDQFPWIEYLPIMPDNARSHRTTFGPSTHLKNNSHHRRRRRPTAPIAPSHSTSEQQDEQPAPIMTPPPIANPGNRWDSSSSKARSDALIKSPRRPARRKDDLDSERSCEDEELHEELLTRPSNIQKCQSWPSPKEDSNSTLLAADSLHRLALVGVRRTLTTRPAILIMPTSGRKVERATSLQDWFGPANAVERRSSFREWTGLRREGSPREDPAEVLRNVFESLDNDDLIIC